jgi:hypothetical protein
MNEEKPNLTVSQTTRIATLLYTKAQDNLWSTVNEILGTDDETEVTEADIERIFNLLKAML